MLRNDKQKIDHEGHLEYARYEKAVSNWHMAEQLWLGLAESETALADKSTLYDYLRAANDDFLALKKQGFLNAAAYLDKTNLLYRALGAVPARDGDADKIASLKQQARLHLSLPNQLEQFQNARSALDQAKVTLSMMVNGKRTNGDEDFFLTRLRRAKRIFDLLTSEDAHPTVLTRSKTYLPVVKQVHTRYENWSNYRIARHKLRDADKLTASDLLQKRELYQEAVTLFSNLGNFFSAPGYAQLAKRKLEATSSPEQLSLYNLHQAAADQRLSWNLMAKRQFFMNAKSWDFRTNSLTPWGISPSSLEEADPNRPLSILINGGHDDVCLRAKLPAPSQELPSTTIITPNGAFQLHATKEYYVAVLTPADLQAIDLGHLLKAAAKQGVTEWGKRKSIQADLSPKQLAVLNASLTAGGGHAIDGPKPDQGDEEARPLPALR